MKNLLEQLYAGELVPAELKIEGNEEYEARTCSTTQL